VDHHSEIEFQRRFVVGNSRVTLRAILVPGGKSPEIRSKQLSTHATFSMNLMM
jgi:hypothetical protein